MIDKAMTDHEIPAMESDWSLYRYPETKEGEILQDITTACTPKRHTYPRYNEQGTPADGG